MSGGRASAEEWRWVGEFIYHAKVALSELSEMPTPCLSIFGSLLLANNARIYPQGRYMSIESLPYKFIFVSLTVNVRASATSIRTDIS